MLDISPGVTSSIVPVKESGQPLAPFLEEIEDITTRDVPPRIVMLVSVSQKSAVRDGILPAQQRDRVGQGNQLCVLKEDPRFRDSGNVNRPHQQKLAADLLLAGQPILIREECF